MTRSPLPPLRGAFTALVTPFHRDGSLDERSVPRPRRVADRWPASTAWCRAARPASRRRSPRRARRRHRWTVEAVRADATGAAASPSSPAPAPTTRPPRSRPRAAPPRSAPTPRWSWRRTTTGPTSGCWRPTTAPSPTRAACRSSSTTCPSRTGTNVEAATLLRLAEHPRIVGVKEASANLDQIQTILRDRPRGFSRAGRRRRLDADRAGARRRRRHLRGLERDPAARWQRSVPRRARATGTRRAASTSATWTLFRANFISPNPVPVKAALAAMGLIQDIVRQPLLPLADEQRPADCCDRLLRRRAAGSALPARPGTAVGADGESSMRRTSGADAPTRRRLRATLPRATCDDRGALSRRRDRPRARRAPAAGASTRGSSRASCSASGARGCATGATAGSSRRATARPSGWSTCWTAPARARPQRGRRAVARRPGRHDRPARGRTWSRA